MTNPIAAKKVYIDVQSRYLGSLGFANLEREFSGFLGKQKAGALAQKSLADAQIASADRAALAYTRAKDRELLAAKRTHDLEMRYITEVRDGSIAAADRVFWQWKRTYDGLDTLQAESLRKQRAMQDAQVAAAAQGQRAATAARLATIGGAFSMAGTATLGAGVAGGVAGYELIKQGMNWQTFASQQAANSPMTPAERRLFQSLSFRDATKYGANPQDVLLALRYGSELGLNRTTDPRYLQTAIALGLPTGGSAAIAPSIQALGTVRKNFPTYANNPNVIGNMILSASQNSAGVSASQFVSSIPKLLNIAGHIGGANQFPQALALVAALTSAGMPLDEAQTQATNMIAKVLKPAPGTLSYLGKLKKATGIDVSGDFGAQALQSKGLLGVINDLASHNLGPTTLAYLFPNMRGYFGALGLTGNQNASFNNIYGRVLQSPNQNPLGANMARYMGLSSTQTAKLDEQLHVLAITLGVQLLPAFNTLLRDDIVPLVTEIARFSAHNKTLVADLIAMSPYLIGVGLFFKTVSGSMRLIAGAQAAVDVLSGVAAKLAGSGTGTIEGASAAAVGDAAAGTGLAAVAATLGSIAAVGAPVLVVLAAFKFLADHLSKSPLASQTIPGTTTSSIPSRFWVAPGVNRHTNAPSFTNPNGSGPGVATSKAALMAAALPVNWHPSASTFGMPASGQFTSGPLNMAWDDGHTAAGHWDFGAGSGGSFPVKLPGGEWRFVQQQYYNDSRGLTQTWMSRNGGFITFMHLAKGGSYKTGQWVKGGTIVAKSGWSGLDQLPGWNASNSYKDAHLHVSVDALAKSYIANGGRGGIMATSSGHQTQGAATTAPPAIAAAFPNVAGYWPQIQKYAKKAGVNPYVLASLMAQESSGNINAAPTWNKGENAYDYGLFQYGPPEAASVHGYYGPNLPAWQQIQTAANYLGKVGLTHWNGSAEAKLVMARANAWMSAGGQTNYAPKTGAKSGKTNPQTAYQWAQWWASRGSTLSGNITNTAGFYWPNANLTNPTATQRSLLTPFLDAYYKDEYQSALSFAHSEYGNNPKLLAQALQSASHAYRSDLAHPFWNFFQKASTSSSSNRVSPVQAVGSNHQLAVVERQLRVEEAMLKELRKQTKQKEQEIALAKANERKLIQWINHHGGHASMDGSGIVTVGAPGG